MNLNFKIIHIEDVPSDAELVERELKRSGIVFEKVVVDTKAGYIKALEEFQPDIILSDHSLPAFNSLEALSILKQSRKNIPFILITSTISEEFAVNVMIEGASDYILKDRLQRLPSAIINAIEKFQSNNEKQAYLSKIVASEALFTKAELIAGFGTWRFNINTKIIDCSAGTYPLLGYKQGEVELTFEIFFKNVFPDDVKLLENVFKNTNDLQSAGIDIRVINKDGSIRYVHFQFESEIDESGKPAFIIGFNQDVTRSRLAQLELQKSKANLNTIVENTDIAYVLCNSENQIVSFNIKANALFSEQFDKKLKVGSDVFGYILKNKIPNVKEAIQKILRNEMFSYETSYDLKDGAIKWYEVRWAGVANEKKAHIGFILAFKDITEHKEAELDLKKLNESLQKHIKELAISNTELEQFAYVASHDLQEPLRMITSFLTLIENKYGAIIDERGKQYINFAVEGAKRMREMILDLLDFSRVGKIEDDLVEINLNNLINEILLLYRKQIKETNAKIVHDNLPTLHAHKGPIRQILANLIANSLKYHKSEESPIINISGMETIDHWQFSVKDNGIGINAEYFDKIFIIFQRLHNKDEYSGTGMGLAIVKKVVENLGGKIWVESEEGKGSTFYFTILK